MANRSRADLSARLDRDVRLDNDADCFALSEAWDDRLQYPLVMGLIPRTGVGGGLVLNRKSITGRSYITGEFGHIRLPVDALTLMGFDFPLRRCGCGQLGCIESYLPAVDLRGCINITTINRWMPVKLSRCGSRGDEHARDARRTLSGFAGGVSWEYPDYRRS